MVLRLLQWLIERLDGIDIRRSMKQRQAAAAAAAAKK
jgi:hypothetical protein